MANIRLCITATFFESIDTEDYVDDFREANALEEEDDVDQEELKKFALEQYQEAVGEGNVSLDDLNCNDIVVEERK